MKIKGHAQILLRDKITGAEQRFEHDNDITDFAAEYFRECGALNWNPLGSLPTQSYTLDDLFGGIMVLEKPILANSAQFPTRKPLYVPANNNMIGNGTIDNSANSPQGVTELGQYNTGESSADTLQRTYVYDWDTNEAVGDISCICLTTRAGGYIGAGNAHSGKADMTLERYWSAYPGTTVNTRTIDADTQSRLCALDIGEAQVATITTTAAAALQAGSVTVNWYDSPISKLNPFENITTFKDYTTPGGVKTLNTPRRTETHTFTAAAGVTAARVMGGTGYILLVGANGNNIQNGRVVNARQIEKDGTVTTFTATVAGMTQTINLNDTHFIGGQIINGDLYLAYGYLTGTSNTTRVKIAANGAVTDLTMSGAQRYDFDRVFFNQEGRVYLGGYSLTNGSQAGCRYYDTVSGEIVYTNARGWKPNANDSGYQTGLWACYDSTNLFVCAGKTPSGSPTLSTLSILRPPCNWLSTINNLDNTITKTGTQTMKIRYTLTLYNGA